MKQSQNQTRKQINVTHNDVNYTVTQSNDGWLHVTGQRKFHFRKLGNERWVFTVAVDPGLQAFLQNEAITQQLL